MSMSRPTSLLPMSQLIANDAPLLSPLSSPVESQHPSMFDSFAFQYTASPAISPLKSMRGTPEAGADPEQRCIPTHQVFDFALDSPPEQRDDSEPPTATGEKRAASNPLGLGGANAPKKPRAEGTRITTREFVPPDVSGLSKREARLVKNRAAAFLSRQRKREEFEQMEIRVAELEQENARLRSGSDDELLSEVEQLRAQLAASEQRTRELSAQLIISNPAVKLEQIEPEMPSSRSPSPALSQVPHRSAASLGLMVLLCALPTLISMQTHAHDSHLPSRFSLPFSAVGPHSDAFSAFVPTDFADLDLDLASAMDIDFARPSGSPAQHQMAKLEFPGIPAGLGLGDLDISFDAAPAEDGKIRVRIHHPSAAADADASFVSASSSASSSSSASAWSSAASPSASDPLGPFLGVGGGDDDDMGMSIGSPFHDAFSAFDAGSGSDGGDFDGLLAGMGAVGSAAAGGAGAARDRKARRRVRIALKSMPKPGGEGGEWEVQVC